MFAGILAIHFLISTTFSMEPAIFDDVTKNPSIKYSAISKPCVMTHPNNYFALMPTYVEISQLSEKYLSNILNDGKSFDYKSNFNRIFSKACFL